MLFAKFTLVHAAFGRGLPSPLIVIFLLLFQGLNEKEQLKVGWTINAESKYFFYTPKGKHLQ